MTRKIKWENCGLGLTYNKNGWSVIFDIKRRTANGSQVFSLKFMNNKDSRSIV